MKCKRCGHRSNSLKAMADHYRKKHPAMMKAKKPRKSRANREDLAQDEQTVYKILRKEGLI